jgi:hypothetical protein
MRQVDDVQYVTDAIRHKCGRSTGLFLGLPAELWHAGAKSIKVPAKKNIKRSLKKT